MIQNYNKALFSRIAIFDRDDTLIKNIPGLKRVNEIDWLPGRLDTLIQVTRLGYDVAIATNQGAVAKGTVSINDVYSIHDAIAQTLIYNEINLTAIAFCPHHPKFIRETQNSCVCRKPAPGLLNEIHLSNKGVHKKVIVFGDTETDLEAARRFNFSSTRGVLVRLEEDFMSKVLGELLK